MDNKKQIILYGITGARTQYKVVKYFCIYERDNSIWYLKYIAKRMQEENPSIERIYAIDNRHGLKREYIESYKKTLSSLVHASRIFWKETV